MKLVAQAAAARRQAHKIGRLAALRIVNMLPRALRHDREKWK